MRQLVSEDGSTSVIEVGRTLLFFFFFSDFAIFKILGKSILGIIDLGSRLVIERFSGCSFDVGLHWMRFPVWDYVIVV